MEINKQAGLIFLSVAAMIFTWWFAMGYLNTFVKNVFTIIALAIEAFLTLLNQILISPLGKLWRKIHIPYWMKMLCNFIVGISIFLLDHFYAIKLFEMDGTTFYRFEIKTYVFWVSDYALWVGGFFLIIGSLRLLNIILKEIDYLLNRNIRLIIEVRR